MYYLSKVFYLQTKHKAELNSPSHRGGECLVPGSVGASQSWSAQGQELLQQINHCLLFHRSSQKQCSYFCLQQQAMNLTQSILNVPQPEKAVFWCTHVTVGQRRDNREMQKTSYSTRTRGTISTTPTVNALVIHRRLQSKDRVRRGLADLVSHFSLEHYKFTRCSTRDIRE